MHLGIDLGGTKIETIVLDEQNVERYRHRTPSPQGNYEATIDALYEQVIRAEDDINVSCTIGIGIPGSVSPATGLVQNANSTWLIGHRLAEDLGKRLQRSVAIANDADCFTLSESTDGAASDHRCVFGVIIGTGVGGGICINEQVLAGPNAITGEWGHNSIQAELRATTPQPPCYCGRTHCIETYISGPGLIKQAQLEHHACYTNVQALFSAIPTDDSGAITLIKNSFVQRLASSLASVVNILDPDCIVIGGGLSNLAFIYEELPSAMQPFVFSDNFYTPIVKAQHGDSSGVRGAAWLGAKQ